MVHQGRRRDGARGVPGRRVRPKYRIRLKPEADRRLRPVFARIGAPRKRPFRPDPFQTDAVKAIQHADCLVCAPTGSGKTWIAQEAIRLVAETGGKAWYASPLKALTNSKLIEFRRVFGMERVGILTGDRKENADAPIIVGTTEILRNQLYDAMFHGTDLGTDLVVLDEAHFLGDEDRGVVWEEIMIYLPQRVPLLLLSATVGNAPQIADWLESIRARPCKVIEEKRRPVPLFPLFFHPSGRLLPLLGAKRLDKAVERYLREPNPPVLGTPRRLPPFAEILRVLRRFDLLPAIFFMKSRADCDAALERCIDHGAGPENPEALCNALDALISGQPHLRGHQQLRYVTEAAVAAHHSGQLPAWKLVIEQLMTAGLLEAVFATSTVAAGVNFPARSVVFLNSDRYNGRRFVPLDATQFHQTTGRAGRRGKDRIGFAVVLPGKFMDVRLMADLFKAPPEDVLSQIKVNFSMVLNLLLSHTLDQIKEVLHRSFASYLDVIKQRPELGKRLKEATRRVAEFLPEAQCAGPDAALELIRAHRAATAECTELNKTLRQQRSRLSKLAYLQPGRLFLDRRGRMYCVLQSQLRRAQRGVLACRVKTKIAWRKKGLRTRWFPPQKVLQILDRVLRLPPSEQPEAVRRLLVDAARKPVPPAVTLTAFDAQQHPELRPLVQRLHFLEEQIEKVPCRACRHCSLCHGKKHKPFLATLDDFAIWWDSANAVRMRLWGDLVRHLEFLKQEGFVSAENTLTEEGLWASKLRVDQPLMIAEGLRKRLLPDNDPALLAGVIAPLVHDRDVGDERLEPSQVPRAFLRVFKKVQRGLAPLAERKAARGFEVRPMALWAGTAVYVWSKGAAWEQVVRRTGMAEGDLSMLVLRTAENLRQIAALTREYPAVAACASTAIDVIMREPVITPF